MKGFKKLILASAITAVSSSAFAMQALDDETLSATTGQDGLTITLSTDINIGSLNIRDNDGLTGSNVNAETQYNGYFATLGTPNTAGYAGWIAIDGGAAAASAGAGNGVNALQGIAIVSSTDTVLKIDTGAVGAAGTAPVLHIEASLGALDIGLGGTVISVAGDNGTTAGTGAIANKTAILSFDAGTVLSLGASTVNIDLGNQPHGGDLIWGTSTLTANGNGNILELGGLTVNTATGNIALSGIALSSTAVGGSYTSDIGIFVDATDGLGIRTTSADGLNVAVTSIALGTAASIGSVYINDLRMNGGNTIYIKGH